MASVCATDTSPVGVGMGQICVVRAPARLRSILGSCVAVAIYHPVLALGGMAHVVLPKSTLQSDLPGKFADSAVPHLLSLLAEQGAVAGGLIAKIAGGANMFGYTGALQIGDRNAQAVRSALAARGILVAAEDVGGANGRRVTFSPATGQLVVEIAGQRPRTI